MLVFIYSADQWLGKWPRKQYDGKYLKILNGLENVQITFKFLKFKNENYK